MQFVTSVAVVFIFVLYYSNLKYLPLDYDDGFFYLRIQEAKVNMFDSVSIWAYLSRYLPISDFYGMRLCGYVLIIIAYIIYSISSSYFLSHNNSSCFTICLNLIFSAILFCYQHYLVSYNAWQLLFITVIVGSFLINIAQENKVVKRICWIFIGCATVFAVFVILPSGVLVSLAILILNLLLNRNNKLSVLKDFVCFVLGLVFTLLLVHFFILPINDIVLAFIKSGSNITSVGRGYGFIPFALKILFWFRDFSMGILMLFGCYSIFRIIYHNINQKVAWIFFFITIIVVYKYQVKPVLGITTVLAFPILTLILDKFVNRNWIIHKNINEILFTFVLFFLPLLSVIGTNLPLQAKMSFFCFLWVLLFFYLKPDKDRVVLFSGILMFLVIIPYIYEGLINRMENKVVFDKSDMTKKIYITEKRYIYFHNVDSLLNAYNFVPNKSIIWTTTFDINTMAVFDAKCLGLYMQPQDFQKVLYYGMPRPDFLFCTQYDMDVLEEEFYKLGWNVQNDYDLFYVGTDNNENLAYSTNRWLYCRKDNK